MIAAKLFSATVFWIEAKAKSDVTVGVCGLKYNEDFMTWVSMSKKKTILYTLYTYKYYM